MDAFKEQVRKGFQKCKTDIEALNDANFKTLENIEELIVENSELKHSVYELKNELKEVNSVLNELKELMLNNNKQSQIISNNSLRNQVEEIEEDFYEETPRIKPKKKTRIDFENIKDPYEALLAFKAKSNKKELLKQKLVSMVSDNGINLSELKFLFVDHYKYTSKASFYNYLKEAELEGKLKTERINSKNIVFLKRERQMMTESMYE